MKKVLFLTTDKFLLDTLKNRKSYTVIDTIHKNNYKNIIKESNLIIIDNGFYTSNKARDKINIKEIASYLDEGNHNIPVINFSPYEIEESNIIKRPFHLPTFMELIDNILHIENLPEEKIFETKHHIINCNSRFIQSKETGKKIKITEREVEVLDYLNNANTLVSKQELLRDIWGYSDNVNTRAVENIIYKLRRAVKESGMPELLSSSREGYSIIKN